MRLPGLAVERKYESKAVLGWIIPVKYKNQVLMGQTTVLNIYIHPLWASDNVSSDELKNKILVRE